MIGDRIKTERLLKNMTQQDLSKLLDVSPSTIGMYEQNRRQPDNEALKKLAEIFNVSADYLLGRTDIKDNKDAQTFLSEKDEKDIAKHLEKTMELLEQQDSIMFDGEAMDEETKELLRQSLENSMRMAKAINKKYTPKKYRK